MQIKKKVRYLAVRQWSSQIIIALPNTARARVLIAPIAERKPSRQRNDFIGSGRPVLASGLATCAGAQGGMALT
jgi:hypothetical protein